MAMDMATLGIKVDATDVTKASAELDKLSTAGGKTAQSISAVEKAMQGLTGMVSGIGFGMLAKSILDTNREMESLRASLKSVTGSAQGAQAAFNSILTFAKDTPYEVKGLTQTFIMLQNMGIKPTQKVMQSLTDQASLLGGSQEVLTSIALQLGQAHSKGKLQMEDMVVLMQRGVPVMRLLGEITGKNAAELSEMSAKGTITIDMIDKLIIKMGEAAAGSNANAMETLNGKISSLSDAWHTFEDALLNDKSEGFLKKIVTAWTIELDVLTALVNKSSDNQLEKMQGTMAFHQNLKKLIAMSPLGYFIKPSQDESKGDLAKIEQLKAEAAAKEALLNSANKEKVVLGESLQAKKEHEKAAKAAARAEASLAKSFDDTITSLSLNIVEQSQSKRQLEEATLVSKKYNKAMVEQVMVLYDAREALAAKKQLNEEEKSQLDSLIDRYNKATMSARDYYSSTLTVTSPDGIKSPMSGADKAPLLSQFDKTTVAEDASKAHEAATDALKKYNETIDITNQKTQDLGAISSSIFDGALGGISLLTGAFTAMTDEITKNTTEMTRLNEEKQKIADFKPQGLEEEAAKFKAAKKNTKELSDLDKKSVQDQMTGARQIAGAASKMFADKSAGAKAFHAIEVGIAIAQLAMRAKDMAMSAIATIKNIAEGASKLFAQSGWAGFAGVAAMLALMAGLGYMATSGGGGGAAPPPTDTGTGTVLGDPTAVSESIGKTNDLLKTIHASEYVELRGINRGVNNLQNAVSKTLDNLFQDGGKAVFQLAQATLTGASGFISKLPGIFGQMAGKISEFFIGGKVTQSVVAQGIGTSATSLQSVIDGGDVSGNQFADIKTKTSGGIFGKKKTSYSTQYQPLTPEMQKSFNDIFSSVGDTMISLASSLGKGIKTDLMPRLMSAVIPAMRVDLMGLNGEDAAKKLNGVISAMMDTMTTSIFGDIVGKYQKLGEGMLETTVRIASEIEIVKDALNQSGLSITTDIVAVSDALVQAAGGLEAFRQQFESFFDKFYSDAEKQTRSQKALVGLLAEANVILPTTRENYKKLVEGLNMTNPLDQQRYSLLLELSAAADTYYSMLESGAADAAKIAKTQRSLDIQYMELTGDAVGALTEKRKDELAAMDESLRFSQKLVWALTDANTAVSTAISAVSKSITVMTTLATKLRSTLAATTTSTTITADSRKAAQEVLSGALRIAKKGGSIDAIAGMGEALTEIAKPSEHLYSAFVDYARDQAKTAATITDLADYADSQVSMAQQQIDAVNGTTVAVMTIKDAMVALSKALGIKDSIVSTGNTAKDAIAKSDSASARSKAANDKAAGSALALSDAKAASEANKSTTQTQADKDATALTNATKGLAELIQARDYSAAVGAWDAYFAYQSYIDSTSQKIAELTITAAKSAKAAALAAADVLTGASYAKLSSTAAKDAKAASAALAAYKTAKAYDNAAQNAVPTINGFASGGQHEGGWRIVGENGPELEKTGASRIFSNPQSKSLLNMDELLAEIRQLREDARANANAVAKNTAETSRIINRWDGDGMPAVRITA